MTKLALRKEFRDIRSKIPAAYRLQAAQAAAKLFANEAILKQSENIACYLPFKDEFDSSLVIESVWNAKKHCYLPVLQEDGKSLYFVRYVYGDSLRLNRYSILEPANVTQVISPEALDLVITPLIAFDLQGHRLGTGGGYYDRTFAFIQEHVSNKPIMMGLGFAAQQAQEVPSDPWDINLKAILTEKNMINV